MIFLDKPTDVAEMLTEHAANVREQIKNLSESLQAVEALKEEVFQMQSVDFKKYANIIISLQSKNEHYRFAKHLDDDLVNNFIGRHDEESRIVFMNNFNRLVEKITQLKKDDIPPDSEECLILAKSWWDMTMEFIGGDINLLPKLNDFFIEMNENNGEAVEEWKENLLSASDFIGTALIIYLNTTLGYNPFEQEENK